MDDRLDDDALVRSADGHFTLDVTVDLTRHLVELVIDGLGTVALTPWAAQTFAQQIQAGASAVTTGGT